MSLSWFSDNLSVLAALPLIVAALFLAPTAIPKFLVEDPRNDLVFALGDFSAQSGNIALRFRVVAPDGYEFDNSDIGNRGLLGQLFGMGSSRRYLRLVNGGRVIRPHLPDARSDHDYYANASPLGWVRR